MTTHQGLDIAIFGEALADVFPDRTVIGGAPLNVARHLNALQMHPVFITRLGEDALKATLLNTLNAAQFDTSGIQIDPDKPTGQVLVTLNAGEPSYDILPDQAYDHIDAQDTQQTLQAITPTLKYFGTLAVRNSTSRQALQAFIDTGDAPVFLDLNLREPWYEQTTVRQALNDCDYAKMNAGELNTICQMLGIDADSAETRAQLVLNRFKLKQIIITRGEQGCWAIDENAKYTSVAAAPLPGKMADTVGAGDGFAAIYQLGIVLGWPTKLTMERANQFASAVCTLHGAAPETPAFYQPFIASWQL